MEIGARIRKINVFQKCRSIHDILSHNGNRSEREVKLRQKIKAEKEFEDKQCDKKLWKYP